MLVGKITLFLALLNPNKYTNETSDLKYLNLRFIMHNYIFRICNDTCDHSKMYLYYACNTLKKTLTYTLLFYFQVNINPLKRSAQDLNHQP